MGDKTAIEWADATWNPLRGTKGNWSCVKVSEGCAHCYAERFNVRLGGPEYKVGADKLRLDEKALDIPLRWKRPRRIFVCSMTDLFEERVPDEWIDRIFAVMALSPQHTFQVLTKRAERMHAYLEQVSDERDMNRWAMAAVEITKSPCASGIFDEVEWPLPNVWLGVSVETQEWADKRIGPLLLTPAAVRFLSVEPLLGPVDLLPYLPIFPLRMPKENMPPSVDWVIVGGESGGPPERALVRRGSQWPQNMAGWIPKPEALTWVRALRDQCVAAGVPFFFKQFGGPTPKSGGRLLDGKEWSEYPR